MDAMVIACDVCASKREEAVIFILLATFLVIPQPPTPNPTFNASVPTPTLLLMVALLRSMTLSTKSSKENKV
jgi:hypothetical protein